MFSQLFVFRQGVSVQGDLCSGGLCQGGLCPGGLCPGGFSVWGVSGGLCLGVSIRETPHTVTSGQYASYWYAFFFHFAFAHNWTAQGKALGNNPV